MDNKIDDKSVAPRAPKRLTKADVVDDRIFSFCPDDSPLIMENVRRRAEYRNLNSLRHELGLSSL